MKTILKMEELLMTTAAIYLTWQLPNHPSIWVYLMLFFTPDIGMLGYLINAKIGAITYNLFHHKGIAIAVYSAGLLPGFESFQFIGLLLFAHSSFDRIFGFGLKYSTAFKDTHLGTLP